MKPVILYGNSTLAQQIYYESLKKNSTFNVAAFCASDSFVEDVTFCGIPLISESKVLQTHPPEQYDMLSCVDAPSMLRNRIVVYEKLKAMGYFLRNFISPLSDVSEHVQMGENNIVFPFAQIFMNTCLGHSNTVRSSAIVGHDIAVGDGTNIAEGAIIGGNAKIGNSCWLGLNCTVNNRVALADDTLVASGAVVMSNTKQGFTYIGNPAKPGFSHKETGIMMNFRR